MITQFNRTMGTNAQPISPHAGVCHSNERNCATWRVHSSGKSHGRDRAWAGHGPCKPSQIIMTVVSHTGKGLVDGNPDDATDKLTEYGVAWLRRG